jgi:hypothetical protein
VTIRARRRVKLRRTSLLEVAGSVADELYSYASQLSDPFLEVPLSPFTKVSAVVLEVMFDSPDEKRYAAVAVVIHQIIWVGHTARMLRVIRRVTTNICIMWQLEESHTCTTCFRCKRDLEHRFAKITRRGRRTGSMMKHDFSLESSSSVNHCVLYTSLYSSVQ